MTLNILKAYNGDSIHMSYKDGLVNRNIVIDGGMPNTYCTIKNKKGKSQDGDLKFLVNALKEKEEKIDLLILTHVDEDHIGGILRWFEKDKDALQLIDQIWFNSGRLIKEHFNSKEDYNNDIEFNNDSEINTSIAQGVRFEDYIEAKQGLWHRRLIKSGDELNLGPVEFKILSPDDNKLKLLLKKWEKEDLPSVETTSEENDYQLSIADHLSAPITIAEDGAIHNGSSISFIMKVGEKKFLFLADAHPSTVVASLNQLKYSKQNKLLVDVVKLSHHGSIYNNTDELIELIDSKSYIVSTNGDRHSHPHKSLLARIINIHEDCKVYFNYPELIHNIFSQQDMLVYPKMELLSTEQLND